MGRLILKAVISFAKAFRNPWEPVIKLHATIV